VNVAARLETRPRVTAELSADAVLDWYGRMRDLVTGSMARADGVAEINAALHDSLMGVWMAYDGETLRADVRIRPSGMPECDPAVTELFGQLASREELIDTLRQVLPEGFAEPQLLDSEHACRGSPRRSHLDRPRSAGSDDARQRRPRALTAPGGAHDALPPPTPGRHGRGRCRLPRE
jgi:hypothetical protein